MNNFWEGFEKQAKKDAALAIGAAGAGLAGLGALSGHASHIQKKMDYARRGKDYKPESFIDKHPKSTGAASLGIAPALSAWSHRRDADIKSKKVQKVLAEHPYMAQPGMPTR